MSTNHSLEGIWQPVYAELDSEETPRMVLDKMEVELADGKYTVRFGGLAADHGTYEVNADGMTLLGVTGKGQQLYLVNYQRNEPKVNR